MISRPIGGAMTVRHTAAAVLVALVAALALSPGARGAPAPVARPRERMTFAGVPWLTPADTALKRLAERGYVEVARARERDQMVCQGKLFDHWAMVHGWLDEQGLVVRWVVTVLARTDKDEPGAMRGIYDAMVAESRARYGPRTRVVERYRFPYERRDGNEDRALKDGLATIRSEWASPIGDRLTIERDRALSVVLTYEIREWNQLQARRRHRKASDL